MSKEHPSHEEILADIYSRHNPAEVAHFAHLTETKTTLQMAIILSESPNDPELWVSQNAERFAGFVETLDLTKPEFLENLLNEAKDGKSELLQKAWNEYSHTLH